MRRSVGAWLLPVGGAIPPSCGPDAEEATPPGAEPSLDCGPDAESRHFDGDVVSGGVVSLCGAWSRPGPRGLRTRGLIASAGIRVWGTSARSLKGLSGQFRPDRELPASAATSARIGGFRRLFPARSARHFVNISLGGLYCLGLKALPPALLKASGATSARSCGFWPLVPGSLGPGEGDGDAPAPGGAHTRDRPHPGPSARGRAGGRTRRAGTRARGGEAGAAPASPRQGADALGRHRAARPGHEDAAAAALAGARGARARDGAPGPRGRRGRAVPAAAAGLRGLRRAPRAPEGRARGTAAVGELRRVGGSTGTRAGRDGGGSTGTRAGRDGGGSTEIHASKDGGRSTGTRASKDGGGSTGTRAGKDGGGSTGTRAGKDGGGSTEDGANTDDPACKDRVDTEKHAGKNAGANTDDRACRGGVDTGDHVCQDGVNEEVVGNTEKHASQGGASTERAEHTRDAGRR
ncbi:chloride intracellular channel protein 6-like [Meriones unguiculatus]|uniref:chloride intracellular channel protein 6-like n=1 Tax=Meriones unguiculatus TaxID=10047 RepID=UPI00293F4BBB|nr:chloride intracellular channel protein 6-like [Meriones unguiculatus]